MTGYNWNYLNHHVEMITSFTDCKAIRLANKLVITEVRIIARVEAVFWVDNHLQQ